MQGAPPAPVLPKARPHFVLLSAASSLTVSCAGAGILSFPWALSSSRLLAFLTIGILVTGVSAVGMLTLASRASLGGARCYDDLIECAFGRRMARAATAAIVLQQLGSMVGFLVAIADFGAPFGLAPAVLLPVVGAAVLWPLSLLPSLQSLWLPSVLSVIAVVAVSGAVIARAAGRNVASSNCPAGEGGHGEPLELMVWPSSPSMLLECVPILIFGFNGHLQTPIVAAEVRDAFPQGGTGVRIMLLAVTATLTTCALLYTATAVSGVACYGAAVSNDILSNLGVSASTDDPLAAFAGGAMAIRAAGTRTRAHPKHPPEAVVLRSKWRRRSAHPPTRLCPSPVLQMEAPICATADPPRPLASADLALAYPTLLFPLLVVIGGSSASTSTSTPSCASADSADDAERAYDGERAETPLVAGSMRSRRPMHSLMLVALTVCIALVAGHHLNLVFSLIGGSVGSALVCWFPAALLVTDARGMLRCRSLRSRGAHRLIVATGLVAVGVAAFAGTVVTLVRSGEAHTAMPAAPPPPALPALLSRRVLATPAPVWTFARAVSARGLVRIVAVAVLVQLVRRVLRHRRGGRGGRGGSAAAVAAVELRPLPEGVGVEVLGVSPAAVSEMDAGSAELRALAGALEKHALLWLRAPEGLPPSLSPQQLRSLYTKLHCARFAHLPPPVPPAKAPPPSADGNLRGRCFPGYPETNVLGYAADVADWHGLSGWLEPTAWWERASGQFHHDGGFSATAPPPPALVSMYCEEAPTSGMETAALVGTAALADSSAPAAVSGGSHSLATDGFRPQPDAASAASVPHPPGATMFFSTRLPLQLAPTAIAARARRLRCCYKDGFGRVRLGEYPLMSRSLLRPLTPPCARGDHRSITEFESFERIAFGERASGGAAPEPFRHMLVQRDTLGREYVVVHTVCLDHLEEWGRDGWVALPWEASQELLEALLAPAASPPHLLSIDWRPGDLVVFDNLQTQHSVTPTDAYTKKGMRRLMTRTAMPAAAQVLE